MMVTGKGNVTLEIKGFTQRIRDVFFIPELKNNLLSIGQLQERGPANIMKDKICRIYFPSRGLIMQTIMETNRMFVLETTVITQTLICLKASEEDLSDL